MIGRVISNKMTKSAVIIVETKKRHPLYGKIYNRSKNFLVDDPIGVSVGDVVEVVKIRPISKNKHFRISKVLGKDIVALGEEALKLEAKEAIEEVLPEKVEEEKTEESGDKSLESSEEVKTENIKDKSKSKSKKTKSNKEVKS